MQYTGNLPESNDNVTHESPLKEFFILLVALLVIIFGVYYALGFAVDYSISKLSPETEMALFKPLKSQLTQLKTSDTQTDYLQNIVNQLQQDCVSLPYKVKVYVVEQSIPNAMAMFGGNVIVYSGLLPLLKSENALAFVLGHELGHFKNRDHLRGLGRTIVLVTLSAIIFGPDSGISEFLAGTLTLAESSHSRGQESKADEVALDALNCRYGHVAGATGFFEEMLKQDNLPKFAEFISTHPHNENRIEKIKSLSQSLGYKTKSITPLKN